jgi:WD40 repeat protein
MGDMASAIILSLFVAVNSYLVLMPRTSSAPQQQTKRASIDQAEKKHREIIQAAVAESLNERTDSSAGKVKLSIRLRGQQPVLGSIFSPSGKELLVAQGVTATLYDVKNGIELKSFRHSGFVTSVDFSPDGRTLITGSTDKTACLWNVSSGRRVRCLKGHSDTVTSVEFSSDGRFILTGCSDQTARIFDARTGALIKPLRAADDDDSTGQEQSQEGSEVQQGEEGLEEAFASLFSYKTFSAVFFKGGRQVITGDADQRVRMWNRSGGKPIKQFDENIGLEWGVANIKVSADDRHLITHSDEGAQLWNIETGEEEDAFKSKESDDRDSPSSATFSPDGRFILAGYSGNKVKLLNSVTGNIEKEYRLSDGAVGAQQADSITTVAFTRDGTGIVAGTQSGQLAVWEKETGRLTQSFEGSLVPVHSSDVSGDGRYFLIGGDRTASLWDVRKGAPVRSLGRHSYPIWSARFSPDSTLAFVGSYTDRAAELWSVRDGSLVADFLKSGIGATTGAFSPDGKLLLLGESPGAVLWDIQKKSKIASVDRGIDAGSLGRDEMIAGDTQSVAFSQDGRYALTGDEYGTAQVWQADGGTPLAVFKGHRERKPQEVVRSFTRVEIPNSILSAAISADGSKSLTGSKDNTARLWESKSGKELRLFAGHAGDVFSVQFSPNRQEVLTTSADNTAVLWDASTGDVERVFAGHRATVTSAAFIADGKFILTGSHDGTARVWETATGRELCSLVVLRDGTWVVVTPDGRFDTNNLESIHGLNWIAPDDPLHPLPLEIFVRDYYEPRLLPRLLAGEKLRGIRPLLGLNRAQPIVKITGIEQQRERPELVSVSVEATSGVFKPQTRGLARHSGVYDLRLFREGQLVGYEPKSSSNVQSYSTLAANASSDDELRVWRRISNFNAGQRSLNTRTFVVSLPRDRDLTSVEFSAYAFNDDRVKSQTSRATYKLPQPLKASTKGRAYLITIGVGKSADPHWDLYYPPYDARGMQKALYEVLARQFDQVVRVPLVSDFGGFSRRAGLEKEPKKDAVKAVFDLLAGREVMAERRRLVPCVDQLQKASPDDLVLISFSGHGFGDETGNYYLFPSDIGETTIDFTATSEARSAMLRRLISSEELSAWLRDIDAGHIVMILDACQSEAATGRAFKPGPMGSRGLGQLAYDKGMQLLVATQADNQAIGAGSVQNGLLTYALTVDVIENTGNQKLTLRDWLVQAAEAVPKLYENKLSAEVKSRGRVQQPSVFDFARSSAPTILIRDH